LAAHLLLEDIILRKLDSIKKPHYGLSLRPGTVLKIANTPETEFLLQSELLAISHKLEYKECIKGVSVISGRSFTYRGYVNVDGLREGVGISTFDTRGEI
jgi:hypothetical protein